MAEPKKPSIFDRPIVRYFFVSIAVVFALEISAIILILIVDIFAYYKFKKDSSKHFTHFQCESKSDQGFTKKYMDAYWKQDVKSLNSFIANNGGIEFDVSLDKQAYKQGEEMLLIVKRTNRSDRPKLLFPIGARHSLISEQRNGKDSCEQAISVFCINSAGSRPMDLFDDSGKISYNPGEFCIKKIGLGESSTEKIGITNNCGPGKKNLQVVISDLGSYQDDPQNKFSYHGATLKFVNLEYDSQ